jgi:glycosyltransferase involved in cell wall biosynthesis
MAPKKTTRAKPDNGRAALATRAIEALLCDPQPLGDIERAYPRCADAWSLQLPDLASLPRPRGRRRPLRLCIATEDIVGPVRNGGIGTTYAALATMLAERGHDVTILYLKGEEVENETIEHWVGFYGATGIKFVPIPNHARHENVTTSSDQWLRPVYNMYRWLIDNPMDVVHVSEWRGSAFMCLTAKRQGIAFADTLFIVKTSSPWLWNRMYGSHPIDRLGDLSKTYAERRSVELADMVIGGSLHLLRWMASQGYAVPRRLAFVQPNVVSFAHLNDLIARRDLKPGQRVAIDEFVFFGRLEARKGLLTFCQSIRRLLKLGHKLPAKISFMGKPGARLAVRPHQTVIEYIEEETADWPTSVSILTDFQQTEAIGYLLDGARLAVMPSTIENSSLAVYEAAICRIPFIASDAGGTPELVAEGDRDQVLCDAHPIPLAAKLAQAIDEGGYVAAASFDNEANLDVWKTFHDNLGAGLKDKLLKRASPPAPAEAADPTIDVAVFSRGNGENLERTLDSLAAQTRQPHRVLIAVDAIDEQAACEHARIAAAARKLDFEVVPTLDFDAGYGLNAAASHGRGDYIAFLQSGSSLKPPALEVLAKVAQRRGADVLTWFHRLGTADASRDDDRQLVAEMIGGPSETLYLDRPGDLPLLIRRTAFAKLKGFTVDYRVPLHEREFISKAIVSGLLCETVPMDLGTLPERDPAWFEQECYDVDAGEFRILRPYLAALPLAIREAMLAANGLQRRLSKKHPRKPKSTEGDAGGDALAPSRRPAIEGQAPAFVTPESREVLVRLVGKVAANQPWRFPSSSNGRAPPWTRSGGWSVDKAVRNTPGESGSLPRHLQLFSGWAGPHAADGERFSGRVLDITNGAVIGWIADRQNQAVPVSIEVRVNGRRVARVAADLELPSVYKLSELALGHGFRVPLFEGLMARLMPANRAASVDVTTADGVVIATALAAHRPGRARTKSAYQGYLDVIGDATIRGWAWMPHDPQRRLEVTVYLDGRFYTRLSADVFRADLAEHGIGGGDYAFSLRIPERFRNSDAHQMDVFIADTGIALKGSPVIINRRGQSQAVA